MQVLLTPPPRVMVLLKEISLNCGNAAKGVICGRGVLKREQTCSRWKWGGGIFEKGCYLRGRLNTV